MKTQYAHITGLHLYISNLEKFGDKSDAVSIKVIQMRVTTRKICHASNLARYDTYPFH